MNGGGEIDNRIADLKALLAAHQEPGADVEFELLDEGQYQMKARGVTFIADYVRRERGVLVGELSVSIEGNAISAADFNFSSARTRSGHAKHLAERARTKKYDFAALLETLCQKIIGAERDGAPSVLLNELDEPEDDDELDVHGLTLLRRLPAIIFGDGAAGKSLFGLWVLGQLAKQGLAVMFADWEMDERVHRRRLGRLFGNDLPRITYVKCQRALPYEVDRLQRIIRNAGIDYAMLDSIGFAVDGPAEAHEVANRYARAVRQLGDIGTVHTAHTAKAEGSDMKPFGSVYWHNFARVCWNIKQADSLPGADEIAVALYDRKYNIGAKRRSIAFEIRFDLTPQNGSRGNLTIWVEKGRSECRRRGTAQSRSYGSYGRLRWSWPEARRSRMPAAS